jgi:hypothetical protein
MRPFKTMTKSTDMIKFKWKYYQEEFGGHGLRELRVVVTHHFHKLPMVRPIKRATIRLSK